MSLISVLRACGTFIFGSKESKPEQRVIIRRFKVYLLRAVGADGAADEIEEDARIERALRNSEIVAKTKKQQAAIVEGDAKLDRALEQFEKQQAQRGAARAELIDKQRQKVMKVTDITERNKLLEEINRHRDENAKDAAEHVRAAETTLRLNGGDVTIEPESLREIDDFIRGEDASTINRPLSTPGETPPTAKSGSDAIVPVVPKKEEGKTAKGKKRPPK